MKILLKSFLFSLAISFLPLNTTKAEAQSRNYQSFQEWCINKNSLPSETRKTVEVLIRYSGVNNCELANTLLLNKKSIELKNFKSDSIYDLRPISSFINLETLYFSPPIIRNTVTTLDISPLTNLTQLKELTIITGGTNYIANLTPLSGLTNLEWLSLSGNRIRDINPLRKLFNLKHLDLSDNQIRDITPLSGLTNLRSLSLDNNQISNIKALSRLTNLDSLSLGSNDGISDISPINFMELAIGKLSFRRPIDWRIR